MSAIRKALSDIMYEIPIELLELTYMKRSVFDLDTPESLESVIEGRVIKTRILQDINTKGVQVAFVHIDDLVLTTLPDFTILYKIPKERTQDRMITSALSVHYLDQSRLASMQYVSPAYNGGLQNATRAIVDSNASIPMVATTEIDLRPENTVLVRYANTPPPSLLLRCMLSSDEELSHLHPNSYRAFSELCILAVKWDIYKKNKISIDMGQLKQGVNIGAIREIVDSYADANDLYKTYLNEKWGKVSFMNDRPRYNDHLLKLFGRRQ